jgi:hypothetical protein
VHGAHGLLGVRGGEHAAGDGGREVGVVRDAGRPSGQDLEAEQQVRAAPPVAVDDDPHRADLRRRHGVRRARPAPAQAQPVVGQEPARLGEGEGVLGAQHGGPQAPRRDLPSVQGLFEDVLGSEGEGAHRTARVHDLDQLAGDDRAHGAGP